jgi:hypothetical protein
VRRVEDITEALWGTRVSPSTVSNLNKKIYAKLGRTGASKAARPRFAAAHALLVVKILLSTDYRELDRLSNNSISREAVLSIS